MIKVLKARVAFVPAHDSCVVGRFARRSSSSGCVTDSEANPCRLACIVRRSPNLSQRSTSKHSGRRDERIMVKVPKPKKVSASFSIAQNAHAHSDACGRKEQEEQTKCRLRAKLAGRKKEAREEAANKADDDKENAMPSSGATPSSDADNTPAAYYIKKYLAKPCKSVVVVPDEVTEGMLDAHEKGAALALEEHCARMRRYVDGFDRV